MMNDVEYRTVTVNDAKAIAEIYRYYVENTAISFEYEAPDASEIMRRIENTRNMYPYIAAVRDNRLIGYAYADRYGSRRGYDRSAELSIYISPDERGRGIGKALYGIVEAALKKQGVLNAYVCIVKAPDGDPYVTDASLRFHEKQGYRLVGRFHKSGFKFGRWYDTVWMEKFLGDHTDDPSPLIPSRGEL